MSSTKRGGKRSPADNYQTPFWCVHRLLEALDLPGGRWIDPCAGTGNIIQATQMLRQDITWDSYELRAECLEPLANIEANPTICDFLSPRIDLTPRNPDVIIMNPPYRLAQEFIEKCMLASKHTVVLLRLNYLESDVRNAFMRNDCPDIYVLPNRPSFEHNGKTDSIAYAWMHWQRDYRQASGSLVVLPSTPKAERRIG